MSIRKGDYVIANTKEPEKANGFPLLFHKFFDHRVYDISWLCADTFSWQSGDVYVAAYNELVAEYTQVAGITYTHYISYEPTGNDDYIYILSSTPSVGDTAYLKEGGSSGALTETVVGTVTEVLDNGDVSLSNGRGYRFISVESTRKTEIEQGVTFVRTPKGYKIAFADQHTNVINAYSTYGIAWFYILDTTNKRFKLPRTKFGFTGLRDAAGNYVAPGLPNITAKMMGATYGGLADAYVNASGACRTEGNGGAAAKGGEEIFLWKHDFDASRSSSVYGASTTVQPPATEMYLYFFVGNYTQTAIEQTAGISAETLNNKADLDGMNAPALMKAPQFWQGADFAKMRSAIMDLDWANAIRTWSSTADSYRTEVMPADGLLAGVLSYSGQIEINGNKYSIGTTDSNWAGSYVPFFVKKGDVVKARFNSSYAVLVPFKNQGNADYNPLGFFQYQGQFADSASLPTPKINGWALVGNNQLYYVGTDDTSALVWLAGNTITDLGVTGADYVVDSYDDGNGNWYRVWKSKRIEQGGRIIHDGTASWKVHTFLKPFAQNNYTITIANTQLFSGGAGSGATVVNLYESSATQFTWYWNASSQYGISWYACGYGAGSSGGGGVANKYNIYYGGKESPRSEWLYDAMPVYIDDVKQTAPAAEGLYIENVPEGSVIKIYGSGDNWIQLYDYSNGIQGDNLSTTDAGNDYQRYTVDRDIMIKDSILGKT